MLACLICVKLDELNEDQLRLSSLPVGDLGLCTDNSLTSREVDKINKSHTGSISETKVRKSISQHPRIMHPLLQAAV
jgi:hypothetical protein